MEQEKKERGQHVFHPLQDIGQLFLCLYNGMKKGVHGIGMLISFMKQNVCDRLEDRQLRQRNQRDRKQILRMEDEQSQQVRDILFPRNARTGQHATMIILFATFALQLISLTTTYRGARYYLLDLNPLAPFLFALVIQILLFYFSKQAGQHAHMKPTRYMIFLVIVCISVLTSYVGIINNTISPLNDYKNQYKEYQSSFAAAKDELRTLYGDYVSYERALNSLQNQANQLIQITNSSIASIQKKSGTLQTIQPSTSVTTSQQSDGGSSVTQTTDQKELARALEKIADNEEKVEKLKAAIKQLQSASSAAGMKHMKKELEELSAGTRQQPSQKIYTEFQNLTLSYNHLLDTLNSFLKEAGAQGMQDVKPLEVTLDQMIQMVDQYREFQKLTLTDIQKLQQKHNILGVNQQEQESTLSNLLSAFLPFRNMHQEEYQKFRIDLELQISDSYFALKEHAKVLQALDKEAVAKIMKTLDESYQKHRSFTDITVIAFSRFTQSQAARNTALICFLIASLVDVISAILPFFWINRYTSALHGRKKYGGDPEEELLEQLYYAAASQLTVQHKDIRSYVCDVLTYVNTYIQLYQEVPFAKEDGYVMMAARQSVEQPGYHAINAVLLTLHQLNTISIQDLNQMKIQYYSFQEEVGLMQEDYVYIMSSDLLLWLQQHLLAVLHQQRLLLNTEGGTVKCKP